jgi:hypothetical protein
MSFSEKDMEALGQQLNLINASLDSISDDMITIRNILVAFTLVSAIGFFATLLFFI